MAEKLVQGDKLPRISLNLTDGRGLDPPRDVTGRYLVLLFYRGNW
jgi:peroxiredoxin